MLWSLSDRFLLPHDRHHHGPPSWAYVALQVNACRLSLEFSMRSDLLSSEILPRPSHRVTPHHPVDDRLNILAACRPAEFFAERLHAHGTADRISRALPRHCQKILPEGILEISGTSKSNGERSGICLQYHPCRSPDLGGGSSLHPWYFLSRTITVCSPIFWT